jgi:hypothetical protein
MKNRAMLTTALMLLVLFLGAAAFDRLADASRFLIFRAFVAAMGIGTCLAFVVYYRSRWPLALWPAFVIAVWALTWWDHSPVKPFARFYASTELGMTRAEVEAQLDRHYRWASHHSKPEPFSVRADHMGYKIKPPGWSDVMVVSLYFEEDRLVYRSLHDD